MTLTRLALFLFGLALVLGVGDADAQGQQVDISQVNGLPQKLQLLVDQVNAINAQLNARINTIQTTPGPAGPQGPAGPTGATGPAGTVDPTILAAIQAALEAKQDAVVVNDAAGRHLGDLVGLQEDPNSNSGRAFWVRLTNGSIVLFGDPQADLFFAGPGCTGQTFIRNTLRPALINGTLYVPTGAPVSVAPMSWTTDGAISCKLFGNNMLAVPATAAGPFTPPVVLGQ